MSITALSRDMGRDPAIVRIVTTDSLATITTAGYWTAQAANIAALNFGAFDWATDDSVLISYSNGEGLFTFDATNLTFIAQPASPGSLSNTLPSGDIFVGSAGNVATGVAMSGDATIIASGALTVGAGAITSSKLAANTIQYARVALTAAQFNGMYTAPVLLVAAGGANTMIIVRDIILEMTFVSAQYAAGGAVAGQYDSTVHGAGTLATATLAAATVNADAVSKGNKLSGALADASLTTVINKGVYLSNQTAAFTTGDSTWFAHVWFSTVSTI